MKIYELIALGNSLKDTKVGNLGNESLRKYIRLIVEYNKCSAALEEKKHSFVGEVIKQKKYDINNLSQEEQRDIMMVINPLIDEYVMQDIDVPTKFLTWNELYDSILNYDENSKLSVNEKSMISNFLCSEEI